MKLFDSWEGSRSNAKFFVFALLGQKEHIATQLFRMQRYFSNATAKNTATGKCHTAFAVVTTNERNIGYSIGSSGK